MWKHEKGLEISNDLAASNMLSDSMWQMLKKKPFSAFFHSVEQGTLMCGSSRWCWLKEKASFGALENNSDLTQEDHE